MRWFPFFATLPVQGSVWEYYSAHECTAKKLLGTPLLNYKISFSFLFCVKHLIHFCPNLIFGYRFRQRQLARICFFPPSLCRRVCCHALHICVKVISGILEIRKQVVLVFNLL